MGESFTIRKGTYILWQRDESDMEALELERLDHQRQLDSGLREEDEQQRADAELLDEAALERLGDQQQHDLSWEERQRQIATWEPPDENDMERLHREALASDPDAQARWEDIQASWAFSEQLDQSRPKLSVRIIGGGEEKPVHPAQSEECFEPQKVLKNNKIQLKKFVSRSQPPPKKEAKKPTPYDVAQDLIKRERFVVIKNAIY